MRGLYIHIPFCARKCDYCDFYSQGYRVDTAERYTDAVKRLLSDDDYCYDTVYFGGGTPSIIGAKRIFSILQEVNRKADAEITVECNPRTLSAEFALGIAAAGVNRVSIGCQSVNENELVFLTRRHTADDVKSAVTSARAAGIGNISLDLMLGLPGQTVQSLARSVEFCAALNVNHISAYMLILEPETPMYSIDRKILPDDERTAALYLDMCDRLAEYGFIQYEISSFAKKGYQSRHNLLYWNCDEYNGIGPAAHSYYDGKRYYYPRDTEYFINGGEKIFDCNGGDFEEYAMLRLRLSDGLDFSLLKPRGYTLPDGFIEKCRKINQRGLGTLDEVGFRLNKAGFLVQNTILGELL